MPHRGMMVSRSTSTGFARAVAVVWAGVFSFSVALSVLGAGGCASAQSSFNYAGEPDPRKQEYVLGPSDVLKINVWRNAELSGDATVRPDGTISLPLVGDLRVTGRTPGQVQAELVQRMATFIKDESAIVTVAVSAINSYRFVVSGNVEHPGAYATNHYVTVIEALALAGGPNRYGSPESTVIIRLDAAKGVRRIPINYTAILSGERPEQNLPLLPGDTIYVP
ncbi:MAG TPA: polysaccharide biosynthesis/export family protein [Polyangia bacterium]|nr:polysaccharide biosynthesis/export family protein [Polyangia bacterium]